MVPDPGSSLFLAIGPSRPLAFVLAGLYLGAAACVLAADLPGLVQVLVCAWVLVSGGRSVALHAVRRCADAVVLLVWDGQGNWHLMLRGGGVLRAELLPGACAHPRLVVLPFRAAQGKRINLVLVTGMAAADDLRRLRARLRSESVAAV